MIYFLNHNLEFVCGIFFVGIFSFTILILLVATYKRWQTRQLLEKAGLPTVLWIPRFISYQIRSSSTTAYSNNITTNMHAGSIDKKLGASTITNILPRMERLGGPFGMYGTVYGISTPVIHVAHPTPTRAVLVGDGQARGPISGASGATKSPAYNHFKNFTGDGVFTADGDDWKDKRASVMHCLFRSGSSSGTGGNAFAQILETEANHAADVFIKQVERLRNLTNDNVVRDNIVPMLQRSTIGLIYRYLTHDQETAATFIERGNANICNGQTTHNNPSKQKDWKKVQKLKPTVLDHWNLTLDRYLESITNIRMILLAQSRSFWYLLPRWCYRYGSSMYQEEERTLLPIREFARMACQKAKPASPLARLMSRESHAHSKDILDEAVTLLFAGQDTSAATLSWTIHLLSLYPDIQNKLAVEVAAATAAAAAMPSTTSTTHNKENDPATTNGDYFVTKSLFSRMPYLDAVIKEAMRLYPVAPFVVRKLSHDVPVVSNGHVSNVNSNQKQKPTIVTLPAGAVACIWIYGLHRNPSLWDRPNDFVPERWLSNSTTDSTKNNSIDESPSSEGRVCHEAYMPFALGPRNCVGQPMAQVILRILLARLVLRYQFCDERLQTTTATDDGAKLLQKEMQAGFTVLPLGGVHVAIHQRGENMKQQRKERLE